MTAAGMGTCGSLLEEEGKISFFSSLLRILGCPLASSVGVVSTTGCAEDALKE